MPLFANPKASVVQITVTSVLVGLIYISRYMNDSRWFSGFQVMMTVAGIVAMRYAAETKR